MVLHVAFAGSVSVHVLLRKRDVGSATGWIGLAWLSPFIGSAIYFLFGINRVNRRARELHDLGRATRPPQHPDSDRDDHLAALDRAATTITGRPALGGNAIRLLNSGDEAYPLMLAAIDRAKTSIGLSSYILRDDEAGGPFIDALIRAKDRNVEVRVLIDGIGGGYFASWAYRRLHRNGVRAERFMHSLLPWRMPFLNLRSHKKILVVDGRQGFTGGLNIGAENVRALRKPHPVKDTHFTVNGPVVGQLVEAFANDWMMQTRETLSGDAWFPELTEAGQQTARVVTAGPDQDVEKIEFVALMAITCAQRSVTVMTPYFLCDDKLVSALSLAALRGVAVDVILPAESNHRLVDYAMRANVGPLVASGCRIWKNAPPFDHSKLMAVDGAWALIGSSNWDMRSFRLNFELNLEVYSADLADMLQKLMLSKCTERLTAEELAGRPILARLRDAGLRLLLPYL
jgi:cardiolipin synthase